MKKDRINLVVEDGQVYFYAEVTKIEEHYVDFNVYEVESWQYPDNSPVDVELYLTGTIKWDGCSHITFMPDNYKHLCGKYYFELHCKMMLALYEKVVLLIKNYDKDVAE